MLVDNYCLIKVLKNLMYLLANFTKIWYNKVVLSEARKMKEIKIKPSILPWDNY